jgi:hypothetical protein
MSTSGDLVPRLTQHHVYLCAQERERKRGSWPFLRVVVRCPAVLFLSKVLVMDCDMKFQDGIHKLGLH